MRSYIKSSHPVIIIPEPKLSPKPNKLGLLQSLLISLPITKPDQDAQKCGTSRHNHLQITGSRDHHLETNAPGSRSVDPGVTHCLTRSFGILRSPPQQLTPKTSCLSPKKLLGLHLFDKSDTNKHAANQTDISGCSNTSPKGSLVFSSKSKAWDDFNSIYTHTPFAASISRDVVHI